MSDVEWLAEHVAEGDAVFRIGRRGKDELIAEWSGSARLTAKRDGTQASLERLDDLPDEYYAKIENGTARLLLRSLAGKVALHGAVVGANERAILLLGRSGQGKSTMAAALCNRGAALFADDAAAVERPAADRPGAWLVLQTEAKHWLDDRARQAIGVTDADAPEDEKWWTSASRVGEHEVPLVAIVDLAFSEAPNAQPTLHRLDGVEAMSALVPQAVRFALDEPARHRQELDDLAAMVGAIGTYRLERPRDLAKLEDSVAVLWPLFEIRGVP